MNTRYSLTNTSVDIILSDFPKGHITRLRKVKVQLEHQSPHFQFPPVECSEPSSCLPVPGASRTPFPPHRCRSEVDNVQRLHLFQSFKPLTFSSLQTCSSLGRICSFPNGPKRNLWRFVKIHMNSFRVPRASALQCWDDLAEVVADQTKP